MYYRLLLRRIDLGNAEVRTQLLQHGVVVKEDLGNGLTEYRSLTPDALAWVVRTYFESDRLVRFIEQVQD